MSSNCTSDRLIKQIGSVTDRFCFTSVSLTTPRIFVRKLRELPDTDRLQWKAVYKLHPETFNLLSIKTWASHFTSELKIYYFKAAGLSWQTIVLCVGFTLSPIFVSNKTEHPAVLVCSWLQFPPKIPLWSRSENVHKRTGLDKRVSQTNNSSCFNRKTRYQNILNLFSTIHLFNFDKLFIIYFCSLL